MLVLVTGEVHFKANILLPISTAAASAPDAYPPQITAPSSYDDSKPVLLVDDRPLLSKPKPIGHEELKRLEQRDETQSSSSDAQISVQNSVAPSTASSAQSTLPSPFDDSVASDFKASASDIKCPTFMTNLLADPKFKSCYPISMLMQTSTGFFNAQKKLVSIVSVLDATCKADVNSCADFLNSAAQNLTQEGNCKVEIDQRMPTVVQAWRGLRTYKLLYQSTCLKNSTTGSYCYADAVTNTAVPSDAYLYFLPYGLALPNSSTPSCSWCNQETMAMYHSASADRSNFIAGSYEVAAKQINNKCGETFSDATLPDAESGAGTTSVPPHLTLLTSASIAALFLGFVL
ncbi:hypothetical protein RJ55_01270 [Drechmeria coniospora]|nr:hypothetical protein RJ55_01270 [Drechmeria coniospora]